MITIPKKELINLIAFFPDEYDYLNHFFQTRRDLLKFDFKGLKIILDDSFQLVLMLKITNKFNATHMQSSSKGIYLTSIYNLEIFVRIFAKVFFLTF